MSDLPQAGDVPAAADIVRFRQRLQLGHRRLVQVSGAEPASDLAQAVDEVGEDLLVADEELRVQAEQLEHSTQHLDRLVTAYERLFTDAPVAYVHTDLDGLILRVNRSAARLLAISSLERRSRPLVGVVRAEDRSALREVLSGLRRAGSAVATTQPIEAVVAAADGRQTPVLITGRRTLDAETGAFTVHWEIRPRRVAAAPNGHRPLIEREHGPAITLVAEAVGRIARQFGPAEALSAAVAEATALFPAADDVGVLTFRGRGRLDRAAAAGELARQADALQCEPAGGPAISAMNSGTPIAVDDLARDLRWPDFTRAALPLGVRSLIAVPLPGHQRTVGALTLYACEHGRFDADDAVVAAAFGALVGPTYSHLELNAHLRVALETREAVGQAVGVLMERHRLPAAAAFERLVAVSQQSHRKLRDVAARVVETGENPESVVVPPAR